MAFSLDSFKDGIASLLRIEVVGYIRRKPEKSKGRRRFASTPLALLTTLLLLSLRALHFFVELGAASLFLSLPPVSISWQVCSLPRYSHSNCNCVTKKKRRAASVRASVEKVQCPEKREQKYMASDINFLPEVCI